MKKVLFVATVVKTHIMQFHIPYLKMFKEMGWETAVAARNDYGNPDDCIIPYCDQYYDIPFERSPFSIRNISAYMELKRIISEDNYSIIHCHTPVGGVLTRLAAKSKRNDGVKVFYTAHGFHFFDGAPLKNWIIYYPVEKILSLYTDVLITINREDYERAKMHFFAKNTEYIHGIGVNIKKFQECIIDREKKRASIGVLPEEFMLLSVGELCERKNPLSIIEALHILDLKNQLGNIKYISVGSGELENEIKCRIAKYNLSTHVTMLGYRNDVNELCHSADCFIHPSVREGLGIAPLEAMACGLPIIASNINGMKEFVEDNFTGYCVNPKKNDQIADAIMKMTLDKDFRMKCRLYNPEVAARYDLRQSEKEMMEIYRKHGNLQ